MKKFVISLLVFVFWLSVPSMVFAESATLSLDPAKGTFNQGCSFSANVYVDTGGVQTDGTDAIIFFDTSKLNATSVTNGTIYPDYPGNNIDPAGKVTISGLASVSSPFSGKGILATVNFTVLSTAAAGATQITFDFDPADKGKTTDSNVVQRGTVSDVLSSVVNGSYTIGTGPCGGGASPTPAPVVVIYRGGPYDATPPARVTPLQNLDQLVDRTGKGAGTPELTSTLAIFGAILTVLGILGLALL